MRKFLGRNKIPLIAYVGFWTVYFAKFWAQAFVVNPTGGLTAGHVNIWGDWAIHLTMGSAMAYRDLFLEQSPLLINSVFKYPFFVNQVSAVLIRLGVPFFPAFTVPSFLFCVFTVVALYVFYREILRSQRWAIVASLIFLFNGGLGFVKFYHDVRASKTPMETLRAPPQKYTWDEEESLYWINTVDSMVIPQRSFQLGFPWALCVLAAVYRRRGRRMPLAEDAAPPDESFTPWRVAALGGLVGFLPIVHAHCFAGSCVILGSWAFYDVVIASEGRGAAFRWWRTFALGLTVVALPMLVYFFGGPQHVSEIRPHLGWYAGEEGKSWVLWWWRNWGITPIAGLLGVAIVRRGMDKNRAFGTAVFFLPFAFMFIACNLFLFHPWIWDNTKILVWVSFAVSLFAAVFLRWLSSAPGWWAPLGRMAALVVYLVMTASGTIDLYRVHVHKYGHDQMYSNEDLYLADWARKNTPVRSIWLTGDYHNNWLFNLTGRQAVMTYLGWLWTHSYNYFPVEADVREMYDDPSRDDLFRKYKIDYAIVGQYERENMGADPEAFAKRFPIAIKTDLCTVYHVSAKDAKPVVKPPVDLLKATFPRSATLKPGLIRRTFTGKYFYGKSLVKEVDVDINFRFDSDQQKPFPVPFSIEWDGYIKIPAEAPVRFTLSSDDGAWLTIDDEMLIDNGGSHMMQERSATVRMQEGYHRMKLQYFDSGGGAILAFGWTSDPAASPGIDPDALFH